LTLICAGYVRKVVVADSLAPLVDVRFAHPEAHSALSLLIGVYFYASRSTAISPATPASPSASPAFSGSISDQLRPPVFLAQLQRILDALAHLALVLAARLSLHPPRRHPTAARCSPFRNLMITMLLGGLWHGARWTFVAWGGLHGLYLVSAAPDRTGLSARGEDSPHSARAASNAFSSCSCFHLTCFAWVFFRAQSFQNAWQILTSIASMRDLSFASRRQQDPRAQGSDADRRLLLVEVVTLRPREISPARRLAFAASCIWVLLLFGSFSATRSSTSNSEMREAKRFAVWFALLVIVVIAGRSHRAFVCSRVLLAASSVSRASIAAARTRT
jgi:hypothetical protein